MVEMLDRDSIDYQVAGHSLYSIVNFNEYMVLEIMRDIYEKDGTLCPCTICVEDTFALSLNTLPPRYIQVTSVRTYAMSNHFINEDDVREKVLDAVKKVKESPNH